jgi:hypothetical protein
MVPLVDLLRGDCTRRVWRIVRAWPEEQANVTRKRMASEHLQQPGVWLAGNKGPY